MMEDSPMPFESLWATESFCLIAVKEWIDDLDEFIS